MGRPARAFARRVASCTLAVLLVGPAGVAAQSTTLTLDPQLTQIRWVLPGFPDTVHGTFSLRSGVVRFDPASHSADGLVELDPASGASGNATRDRRMRDEILEVGRHPLITFRPDHLDGTYQPAGSSEIRLSGVLLLHGSEHPFVLPLRVTTQGDRVTADTEFSVPYVAWGLKDPSVLILRSAKSVNVEVHAIGRVEPTVKGGSTSDYRNRLAAVGRAPQWAICRARESSVGAAARSPRHECQLCPLPG